MSAGSGYALLGTAAIATCLSLVPAFGLAAEATPPIVAATVPVATGGAGLGMATRFETSPYVGGGTRNDFVPIYVYEGKRAFIEAYRAGLKLNDTPDSRLDAFFAYRFEGTPYDRIPVSLAGMANRGPGCRRWIVRHRNTRRLSLRLEYRQAAIAAAVDAFLARCPPEQLLLWRASIGSDGDATGL